MKMEENKTSGVPKAYETVPLSRSQAVGDSLAYVGDTITNCMGRAKIGYENYLSGVEQKNPRTGKVARVAIPLALYLAVPAAKAMTIGFDQMATELFDGYNKGYSPHELYLAVDPNAGPGGEIFYQIPVEWKDNAAIHVINATGFQIADVHPKGSEYVGAIVGINDSKNNIVSAKSISLWNSMGAWSADTEFKKDSVQKALKVAEYVGLVNGKEPAEVNVYLGENGAFKKCVLNKPANEFDATILWKDEGKAGKIHSSFLERASDLVRDLKNGLYKPAISEIADKLNA